MRIFKADLSGLVCSIVLFAFLVSNVYLSPVDKIGLPISSVWPVFVLLLIFIAGTVDKFAADRLFLLGSASVFLVLFPATISAVYSSAPEISIKRVISLALSLLLFLTCSCIFNADFAIKIFAKLAFLLGAILSVFGVIIFLFPTQIEYGGKIHEYRFYMFSQFVHVDGQLPRISSLIENPNGLAATLAVSMLSGIYLFKERLFSRVFIFSVFCILIIGFVFTFSRGSFLALVLPVALMVGRKNIIRLSLIFVPLLAVSSVLIFALLGDFLDPIVYRFSKGLHGRDEMWGIAFEALRASPFLGVGYGVSQEVLLDPVGISLSMHSSYITLLAEVGLIGVPLFSVFLIVTIAKIVSLREVDSSKIYIGGIVLFFMVASLVETMIFRYQNYGILWFGLAGLLWTKPRVGLVGRLI